MITAVDENIEYILESDRGSEEPTVFIIRTLDAARFMRLAGAVRKLMTGQDSETDPTKLGPYFDLCLGLGLVGWRNFRNAAGEEVPYEGQQSLARLLPAWRVELAKAVSDHNGISETDRKN